MEDPRLSRMYSRLVSDRLRTMRRGSDSWAASHRRSLWTIVLSVLFVIFAVAYYAHLQGRFRRLKTELQARSARQVEAQPMPGGQEAVVLSRTPLGDGSVPELLSATLLPGRGMQVLQLTALLPGRGEVSLLASPTLEQAADSLTGGDDDVNGARSLQLGGPIELPWAGAIRGTVGGDGRDVGADWRGRLLSLPLTSTQAGVGISDGGLLLKAGAEAVMHDVMPDGGSLQATFAGTNFGGRWPSQVKTNVSVLLSSRAFEMTIQATNAGREMAPIGVGWMPRFVLPSGNRQTTLLRLPAEEYEVMRAGRATGQLVSVKGTPLDFTDRKGRALGSISLDDTFVYLRSSFLENGPAVEVRDTGSGVGLRLTAMSPQIRALRVEARPEESTIGIGFQTNYDDPLRREWPAGENTGMQPLQPGQSVQWRVRLELMALTNAGVPPL